MGTIIKVNGEQLPLESNTLDAWQDAVGGFVEPIYGKSWVMLVNEEGQLMNLPLNVEASRKAGRVIVGDVILFTLKEWDDANN